MSDPAMQVTVKVRTSLAWWVMPYLKAVTIASRIPGVKIDPDKVTYRAMKGVRVRVEK
jgi:hypothetical protein